MKVMDLTSTWENVDKLMQPIDLVIRQHVSVNRSFDLIWKISYQICMLYPTIWNII